MTSSSRIAAIVIGRNEGERLIRCLNSIKVETGGIIYVDSGSTDGSQDAAAMLGAHVVALDTEQPFTAARARNAGLEFLAQFGITPEYVQFVDGDCEVRDGWIDAAARFLDSAPKAAVACGRRRERAPETSVYNRLIDREWDTPVGQAKSCGGDALMRLTALTNVGGYRSQMIAGEEPELCVRLRAAGWEIWRLDLEMTWHDAAITQFRQWWQRARRAGHAFAEGAALHGRSPEKHNVTATRRAMFWGLCFPILALLGLIFTPFAAILLLAYPVQILRLARRTGDWAEAVFLTVGKFPEAQGALRFWIKRLIGQKSTLIEYK